MIDNRGLTQNLKFMTPNPLEAPVETGEAIQPTEPSSQPGRMQSIQAVLEQLFGLYPHLFGARFLPLKLGIFQELLATHPELFKRDTLKAALGLHTRSTRYLQSVAAGNKRHDLQGVAVENVAPEHVHLSLMELFRRRQGRSREDLLPGLRGQLMGAFEASGLTRQDYLVRVQSHDEAANALLDEAFAERDQKLARQEALLKTLDSSGMAPEEFARTYGLDKRDVLSAMHQHRRSQAPTTST